MFTHEKLDCLLKQYPQSACFWVAYSGGLDSQVLLYALSQLVSAKRLRAIHINHGLQGDSDKWATTCQAICEKLAIYCEVVTLVIKPKPGESLEACAREARYRAMAKRIPAGDFLLTGHHQNDQAETFLLQLFRGAGLKGLVSMPFCQRFASTYLIRPLLEFTRKELYAYAQMYHLTWIEDDSNSNLRFNRNFIRHQLLPLIQQRWPKADKTIARSAANLVEAHALLDEIGQQDWNSLQGSESPSLSISRLMTLSVKRQTNVLRYGLKQLHCSLPSQKQLKQINVLLNCRPDASPHVNWGNVQLRRYRDYLYFFNSLEFQKKFTFKGFILWHLNQKLVLPTFDQLITKQVVGTGLNSALFIEKQVEVTFRQGGERFYLSNQNSRPLKKLFQEWGVPPWQRSRVPLIYYKKELIAVAGYAINPHFSVNQNESGVVIEWIRKSSPSDSGVTLKPI